LDIGVLGYIGIVWPMEHSPEVRSFPPGTPCIYICQPCCFLVLILQMSEKWRRCSWHYHTTLWPTGNPRTRELQTLLFSRDSVLFIPLCNSYRHGPLNTLRYLLQMNYIYF